MKDLLVTSRIRCRRHFLHQIQLKATGKISLDRVVVMPTRHHAQLLKPFSFCYLGFQDIINMIVKNNLQKIYKSQESLAIVSEIFQLDNAGAMYQVSNENKISSTYCYYPTFMGFFFHIHLLLEFIAVGVFFFHLLSKLTFALRQAFSCSS